MSNEYSQFAEVGIDITFNSLVSQIQTVHTELAAHAGRAVNISLTIRNWLIGYYIAEYEQNGADRAEYGDRLIERLSTNLSSSGVVNANERELRRYRKFYTVYPQIRGTLFPEFRRSPCWNKWQFGRRRPPNWRSAP